MIYSIWKDLYFYIYILLVILSAVVIVYSIRRLFEEESDERSDTSSDIVSDTFDITSDTEKGYEKNTLLNEDSELNRLQTSQQTAEEEIVFKKEETIFDTNINNNIGKENITKEEDKAVIFLKTLNENLSLIKDGIDRLSEIEKRILDLEDRIKSFESDIKEILKNEIYQQISQIDLTNLKLEQSSQIKTTPKYVSKYLEDILDDFETLEKDVIKKRLKVIAEDLKKIASE